MTIELEVKELLEGKSVDAELMLKTDELRPWLED
jgi:hypothetical protein